MAKPAKKTKGALREHALTSLLPWSCTHFGAESEIEAYVETSGKQVISFSATIGAPSPSMIMTFLLYRWGRP